MNEQLLKWLMSNRNKYLESPRSQIFKTDAQCFEITKVDKEKGIVKVEFEKKRTPLPLAFWRFETALDFLERNRGKWVRLGTRFYSDDPDTVEYQIQQKARQVRLNLHVDLKSASHVCDLLVLSGIAEYGKTINPMTNRENQAIRLVET